MVSIATWSLLVLAGLCSAEVRSGSQARIEDYPSIVQVENQVATFWVQTCVGSVLTSRHVLSVAHCFFGPLVDHYVSTFRRIRAGASERGRDGQVVAVDSVVRHPSFGSQGLDANVVVVRLQAGLTFGDAVKAVSITGSGTVFPANVPVTVAGWGRTAQDATWADRDLYSVNLVTVDNKACGDKYRSLIPDFIPLNPTIVTENMLCLAEAGYEGTEMGIRDGGAPVYYDGVLVGLVAFGSPYGKSIPLVSTAIAPYSSWIVATAAV